MPILANVLLRKRGELVEFITTDTEIQMTTSAGIGAGTEEKSTTVGARKLLDILKSLGEGAVVTLSMTGSGAAANRMTVQAGKSRFTVQTMGAETYPTVAVPDEFTASVTIPQKKLRHLLNMVHFSMAQHDVRHYLNGMLLEVDGAKITAVATDGHRLALCSLPIDNELPSQQVIIPRKTVSELLRLLEDNDSPVLIDIAAGQVKFSFEDIVLVSKLLDGRYPDYTRVIPKGYENEFAVERSEILRSLQRAAIMTSEKHKGVRVIIEPGVFQIKAANTEQEEGVEEIAIDYGGPSVELGMNVNYLLDFLNNVKCEQVRFEFAGDSASILISIPGDDGFEYVVMPMRL
jgi:DNA polymerase-3 subunit beta